MREEKDSKAILFSVVCGIIFLINLIGFAYGAHIDKEIETKREALVQIEEDADSLTQQINALENNTLAFIGTIIGLVAQMLIAAMVTMCLFIPEKLYDYLKWDMFEYAFEGGTFQTVVRILLIVMTIWNIISPILDIKDLMEVQSEMNGLLDGMLDILSDESWFSY